MKIIGFYTVDTPYEQEAEEMKKTLDKFNLSYQLYEVDNQKSWELNCAQKSRILRMALDDFDENILYLDVDARVMRQPPFEDIEKDIPGYCVWYNPYQRQEQLCSGTIYFPNNYISRRVIEDWIYEQQKDPKQWDQVVLQRIYQEYDHFLLHDDWINIERNTQNRFIETDNPIIVHTQASRRNKKKV